jgi:hypothetical protein
VSARIAAAAAGATRPRPPIDANGKSSEPFKILTAANMRRLCQELTPAALKVWLFHLARSGPTDASFPKLETVACGTDQSLKTVKSARRWLHENGWLLETSRKRFIGCLFVPVFRCTFPPAPGPRKVENPPTVDSSDEGQKLPLVARGKNCPTEVDSKVFEVNAGSGVQSAEKLESDRSSSSRKGDDEGQKLPLVARSKNCPTESDWEAIELKIQQCIEEAKALLLRKGWDPHLASAALQLIEERSDHSGTIPKSAKYFIVAIDTAMADPRDKAEIFKRAGREQTVKTDAHVGGISAGPGYCCNWCGMRFSSSEAFNKHVCPEESKLGNESRPRQRADAGLRAKGAAAGSRR